MVAADDEGARLHGYYPRQETRVRLWFERGLAACLGASLAKANGETLGAKDVKMFSIAKLQGAEV